MGGRLRFRGRSVGNSPGAPDAEAEGFIARAGLSDPLYMGAARALVTRLKGFGLWSKLDWAFLLAGESEAAARKNLIKDDFHLSLVNAPAFAAGQGITFANNKYATVDFIPATDAIAATLNSVVAFAWAETNVNVPPALSGTLIGGTNTGGDPAGGTLRLMPKYDSDLFGVDLNSANTSSYFAHTPATYVGFWAANRTAGNLTKGWLDGVAQGSTAAAAVSLPVAPSSIGAQRFSNGFTSEFFPGRVSIAGYGGGVSDADMANLHVAFAEYRTAIGLA